MARPNTSQLYFFTRGDRSIDLKDYSREEYRDHYHCHGHYLKITGIGEHLICAQDGSSYAEECYRIDKYIQMKEKIIEFLIANYPKHFTTYDWDVQSLNINRIVHIERDSEGSSAELFDNYMTYHRPIFEKYSRSTTLNKHTCPNNNFLIQEVKLFKSNTPKTYGFDILINENACLNPFILQEMAALALVKHYGFFRIPHSFLQFCLRDPSLKMLYFRYNDYNGRRVLISFTTLIIELILRQHFDNYQCKYWQDIAYTFSLFCHCNVEFRRKTCLSQPVIQRRREQTCLSCELLNFDDVKTSRMVEIEGHFDNCRWRPKRDD